MVPPGELLTYTEMVSSRGLLHGERGTAPLLAPCRGERPFAAQIFGSDPAVMAEAALRAAELSGASVIDINMGCPAPKITSNGDGCALMRDPGRAQDVIEAVVGAADLPVTVKFRAGWDSSHVNALEFGLMCQQAGASAVCLHARTRAQMYSGQADWALIGELAAALTIPVIANGDIRTGEDAARVLGETGAACAMIGRAAFSNPWVFRDAWAALNGKPIPSPPSARARCAMALEHFTTDAALRGERTAVLEARKHFCRYLRGLPHMSRWKELIVRAVTLRELEDIAKWVVMEYNEKGRTQ